MSDWRIITGDALESLRGLDAGSVQCCVTSPPYWGLRDYGVGGQLGLEATPEEYVSRLVEVFAEVRRVLADDGVLWLNMGDCHVTNPSAMAARGLRGSSWNLKHKDLVGMPWRLALALQADGWYLRCDVIWNKPNPMPESAKDRPTKSHEYLFLLSKSRRYYYAANAIAEPVTGNAHPRGNGINPKAHIPSGWNTGPGNHHGREGRYKQPGKNSRVFVDRVPKPRKQNPSWSHAVRGLVEKRNRRSVWTIATRPFPGAHFATFPPALIEPCILAGSRTGDLVLDHFVGSGTTGVVALRLGRDFLGIELSPEYVAMAERRIGEATRQGRLELGETP